MHAIGGAGSEGIGCQASDRLPGSTAQAITLEVQLLERGRLGRRLAKRIAEGMRLALPGPMRGCGPVVSELEPGGGASELAARARTAEFPRLALAIRREGDCARESRLDHAA